MVFNVVAREFSKIDKYDSVIDKLGGTLDDDVLHSKALSQSGLTTAVYEYITSLGVSSAAEMTFSQKLKLTTIALKEQAAAFLASPLGKAVIIGAAIFAVVKIIDAVKQSIEEARQEAIESAEAAATLSDEVSSLATQYILLSEAVKTDESAKESLLSVENELIDKLGLEQYQIDKLVAKYGNLSDAIKQASIEQLKLSERDLHGGVNAYEDELIDAAKAHTLANKSMNHIIISWAKNKDNTETNQAGLKALVDAGYISSGSYSSLGAEFWLPTDGFDLSTVDGIIAAYERLGDMMDIVAGKAGTNNEVWKALYDEYNRVSSALNNYTDCVGNLNKNIAEQYVINGLIGTKVPETKAEFDAYRQSVIEAAKESGQFVGSAEQIESAIDSVLKSDVSFAKFYTQTEGAIDTTSSSVAALTSNLSALKEELSAVKTAISEQAANGSITLETYNALIAASSDYASCIEYENGYMQLNTAKARELAEAKAQLQILEIEQAKVNEAENYRKIAEALENATSADEDYVASLQAELDASGQLITRYRVMQSELAETLSAYSKWKDVQSASETGDMYDDTLEALEQIKEGLESGKVGTAKYEASVEMLIPEANKEDVSAYVESLERYLSEDITGVANFVSDALSEGLMIDDGSGNISIVSDATIKDFCDKLKITPSMAQAIFGELEEYGWKFDWTAADFIDAIEPIEPIQIQTEVDMDALAALQQQLTEYRAQRAAMENDPLTLQFDMSELDQKIAITEQAIVDACGVVPVDTTEAQGRLQAVQESLDKIADKADIVAAKIIGDMGARETIVSLQTIIDKLTQIDAKSIRDKHYNVYQHTITDDSGQSSANGTDYAKGGKTLVGEFGPELVVSGNQYRIVGSNGAEFVNLRTGDMVFNHVDTRKILDGKSGVRGQAMWNGTSNRDPIVAVCVLDGDSTGNVTQATVSESLSYNAAAKSGISGGGKDFRGSSSGSSSGSGGGSSSKSDTSSDEESWFERQYKDHQHLLEMDKESTEDYLKWLDDAYKKAYEEGIIDLDDFYKYEEEVYKGRQDLFKDYLNDIDHEMSMLEAGVGNSDEIINLALQAIQRIEKELAAARAAGLDENGDYIQYLEQQWLNYSQTVTDLREDAEASAKNAVDDLVEYRIKMLKQDIENQKDALSEELDDLQDFYDKQRQMLQDQYDEEKYLEEQSEKRKSVTDIQSELAMLEHDDSAWAQKRKLELQAELSDAQKELNDFEKDHALDTATDLLDEQQAAQEAQIQAEIEALDEKLNDPHALYNQALADIKNNTQALYNEFIEYNRKYGTGNDEDVVDIWEEAYKADLEYQDTHNGEHLDDIAIGNYTGYVAPENPKPPEGTPSTSSGNTSNAESSSSSSESQKPSLSKGSSIQVKSSATHFSSKSGNVRMASFVPGGTYTVYKTDGSEVLIGRDDVYTGWINKSDIVGYRSGTGYSIAGLAEFDEDGKGSEYIFESSDGSRYRMFGEGSKVLNSDATNFLYEFATSGGNVLMKMLSNLFGLGNLGSITKPVQTIDIHAGDIVVQGNATEHTVSEIRRAQRDNLKFVIAEFNKLNK